MASTHSIESETTVRTIRDEEDFTYRLGYAMGLDDANDNRDGLLDLLDMDGLTHAMVERAMHVIWRNEREWVNQRRLGNFRICLRLIALHRTSMHFDDCTVRCISDYLQMVVDAAYMNDEVDEEEEEEEKERFAEMLHNEHYIPFVFEATLSGESYGSGLVLACLMIKGLSPSHTVTLLVRYWPLLPEIFMACFGVKTEWYYATLYRREFAGLLATTPSLLDKLLAIVNDPHEYKGCACDVLESLLTTTLATSPPLLEHLLGCGLLTAVVSCNARAPRLRTDYDDDVNDAATIRAVLAAYPCWTQTVKRIADGAVEEDNSTGPPRRANAVIEMAKALPSRHTTGEVEYNLM